MTTFLAEGLQLSEIPNSVKDTIVRAIDIHGGDVGFAIGAAGLALVSLQKQHPEIVLDPLNPMGVYFSTLPYKKEVNENIAEHLEKYAKLLKQLYEEDTQNQVQQMVQEMVDAFYGPGTEVKGWRIVSTKPGEEPVTFEGGEDIDGANQLTAGETEAETALATENTDLNQGAIVPGETRRGVPDYDVEAAADNVVPKVEHPAPKRLPCGGLTF